MVSTDCSSSTDMNNKFTTGSILLEVPEAVLILRRAAPGSGVVRLPPTIPVGTRTLIGGALPPRGFR